MSDSELLREFAIERSGRAFAELVRLRIDFVYAAALRQLAGDHHRAEDVTQEVFADLARKAASLARHPDLLGWLYTATHYAALNAIRMEQRRRHREAKAHAMNDTRSAPNTPVEWDRLRPVLDAAMHELNERDRRVVLLRFFDRQSFAAIGARVGLTENAAQKSADRALDRLQAVLSRRGITSTSAALSLGLTGHLSATAPIELTASVTSAALSGASGTGIAAGTSASGLFTFMSATKVTFGVAAVIAATAIGLLLHERTKASQANVTLGERVRENSLQRAEMNSLQHRIAAAEERARAAEDDNTKLLDAVGALNASQKSSAATEAGKNKSPRPPLTRGEAYAEITSLIEKQEASVRSKPGYRPYQPPDQSLIPPEQRAGWERARAAADAKNLLVFPVVHEQGFIYPVTMKRIADEPIARHYPALTREDWQQLDERYAMVRLEMMLLNPPKFASPTSK